LYDSVTGWLIALLVLVTTGVGVLFFVWLVVEGLRSSAGDTGRARRSGRRHRNRTLGQSMQLDSPTPQQVAQDVRLPDPEFHRTWQPLHRSWPAPRDLDDPSPDETQERRGRRQACKGPALRRGSDTAKAGRLPARHAVEIRFAEGTPSTSTARH